MRIIFLLLFVANSAFATGTVGQCNDYHDNCGSGGGGYTGSSGGSGGYGGGEGVNTGGGSSQPTGDISPALNYGQTEPPIEATISILAPFTSDPSVILEQSFEPELIPPYEGQDLGEECADRVYEGTLNQIVFRAPFSTTDGDVWIQFDVFPATKYIGDMYYFGWPNGIYEKKANSEWPHYEKRKFMFCTVNYGQTAADHRFLCSIFVDIPMGSAGRQINYAFRWRQVNTGEETHIVERCSRIIEQE